jgi:hypothetical protein
MNRYGKAVTKVMVLCVVICVLAVVSSLVHSLTRKRSAESYKFRPACAGLGCYEAKDCGTKCRCEIAKGALVGACVVKAPSR